MTDYNLIDRITAIHLELENETSNSFTILIAIRNILNQSDGMSYPNIRNILIRYYQLNPVPGINSNLINLVTSPNANTNNSINYMLLNQFNYQNLNNPININVDNTNVYDNLNSDSDNSVVSLESSDSNLSSDSNENDSNDSNENDSNVNYTNTNDNQINNNEQDPLLNYFSSQELPHYSNPINLSPNNLNDLFTNFQNTNLNNVGFVPLQFPNQQNQNLINNFFSFSNSYNMNLNDYNNINNLFNLFSHMPQNQNSDIPIVITNQSFDDLKKCKYVDLNDDIKGKNPKCMISLETFKENDDIIMLPCEHVFCIEEATDWLKNNSYKCPVCRHPSGNYYAKI